ncbi:NAD-dependent epimerase/dehydratase family protein [Pedobacter sp. SYSU D00535]|uniref:NAD-dependent epimerase/dehydratase family protein n=1 Tax=Pedobacter sp. SYSU D00535 TaxID=2810308 RepID=UPI001A95C582|nr:NAD-dependent epimerase/dehydratase family protein [Pedobacter sp. SYSU D00535]
MQEKILVFGANGQIGTELVEQLRTIHGGSAIIACDIKDPDFAHRHDGPFEHGDVLQEASLQALFKKHKPTQVFHLAALLSAVGEQRPQVAWELNMNGLLHVLELAVEFKTAKVFWPSSIAVFGPGSPKHNTPQFCVMDPSTVYGISKLAGERWCEYYYLKHGLDVRSIRYPGLMGWKAEPGGGTTDYAVHIFREAIKRREYECFLRADTQIPMMYMPDAIRASLELMEAPAEKLTTRSAYNIAGLSFSPAMLAREIRKHIPQLTVTYLKNDHRQAIANSWPNSIDDSVAREDWNWQARFNLEDICEDMLDNLRKIALR